MRVGVLASHIALCLLLVIETTLVDCDVTGP